MLSYNILTNETDQHAAFTFIDNFLNLKCCKLLVPYIRSSLA